MAAIAGFDANKVDPKKSFDALPSGKYVAIMTESGWKENQARTGQYLNLTFEIIEGEFKGRKIWTRLNLQHPNDKAVKIAESDLSSICRAIGIMQPKDTAELHNVPIVLDVKCKKRKDSDEIDNEIKNYERRGAAVTQSAPAGGAAPWKR